MNLEVFQIIGSGWIIHDLADDESLLVIIGIGRGCHELNRVRPVAPAASAVHVPDAGAVGSAATYRGGRGADVGGERFEFPAFPRGRPFEREGCVVAAPIRSMLSDAVFHGCEAAGTV